MSHEMRTPLFACSALSSMLLDMPIFQTKTREVAEIAEMLEVIRKSGDLLVGIVNNILGKI